MRIGFDVNVMRLYNGRRSVWVCLEFGRRALWLSRWDTARVEVGKGFWQLRGKDMTWYAGTR